MLGKAASREMTRSQESPPCALRALRNSENPTLNLGHLALMRFKLRAEEFFETAFTVRPSQPFGGSICVLLVGRSPCTWESPAPNCCVGLSNHREIGRQAPTVERPKMRAVLSVLPDVAQPGNACVRGLRYRPLHVEMEHGFGCTCPQFGQPPPAAIT